MTEGKNIADLVKMYGMDELPMPWSKLEKLALKRGMLLDFMQKNVLSEDDTMGAADLMFLMTTMLGDVADLAYIYFTEAGTFSEKGREEFKKIMLAPVTRSLEGKGALAADFNNYKNEISNKENANDEDNGQERKD